MEEIDAVQGYRVFLSRCKDTGQRTMLEYGINGDGGGTRLHTPSSSEGEPCSPTSLDTPSH